MPNRAQHLHAVEMTKYRLNLDAVENSLRTVQREFPRINKILKTQRGPMNDEIVGNMLLGYAFVNRMIANEIDLFAPGNLKYLLELNKLVLCGDDPGKHHEFSNHLDATESYFYDHNGGCVRDIIEWYARHRNKSPWKRAAGVYVRILSVPQLYIEGNHRCGALIMSYILVREGKPPFVLTVDNAEAYFNPSALIKDTHKTTIALLFTLPRIHHRFANFLKTQADERYLTAL